MRALALGIAMLPCIANADIEVRFIEGTPKDQFEIVNTADCDLGPATIEIDMSESAGGLYFDTADGGTGIEEFQPFELVTGTTVLDHDVSDGSTSIQLNLGGLPSGDMVAFVIDVDDTLRHGSLGQSQVAGSEIAGTSVRVTLSDKIALGVIDNLNRGTVRITNCARS
ncbi:MAG: hypothetical protein ABJ327_03490 [Litoreibacter sp.]